MCALPALPALAAAQGTLALRMQPTIAGVPDGKSGVPAPVYMEGDRMQGHSERETEALGNARARSRGQAIAADWMRFDSRFNELTAIGNVHLEQGAYVAQGVRLRYDFDTERGVMERAKYFINPRATGNLPIAAVPSGVMSTASTSAARQGMSGRGVAERILFEGPGQFHAQRASFTTCEPDNDQWNIRSNDLRIYRDEGVGVARNATVDFKGTPIFYAPYFSFPLHQERKTGFLAPHYGTTSASGFEVTTPFFWNLAPNYDLTITPRVLSKRGLQLRNDFRYLMPAYKGELHVEVLPDDFRYLVFATTSAQRMGVELTGKCVSDGPHSDMVKDAGETYRQAAETKRPIYRRTPPTVWDDRLYAYTRVVLPLGEKEDPDRLFVAIHYDLIE